jgi:hypothetical protein
MDKNAPPIKFTKTLASLNLDEVSARYFFTVDDDDCANGLSKDQEALVSEITNILALPDEPSRIEIMNSFCNPDGTAGAMITIGPSQSVYGSVRRIL